MKATDDPLQRDATFLTDMDERPERHGTTHGSIQDYSVVNCRWTRNRSVKSHYKYQHYEQRVSMQTWTNSQPMPRTALRVRPRKAATVQPLLWYCLGGFAVTRISANPFYLAPLRFILRCGAFSYGLVGFPSQQPMRQDLVERYVNA